MRRILTLSIPFFLLFLSACGGQGEKTKDDKKAETEKEKAESSKEEKKNKETRDGHPPESKEERIRQATLPLPEGKREEATVLGHKDSGPMDTLRAGSNEFICLADDPEKEGFYAACYHRSLDAFMRMGRQLKRDGKSREEIFRARKQAIESGRIQMPDKKNLTVMSGKYDKDGKVVDRYRRYVIYIPFATAESTGLPEEPMGEGEAWIMDPGTHKAHIMVSPGD